jgi:hypothetical protein
VPGAFPPGVARQVAGDAAGHDDEGAIADRLGGFEDVRRKECGTASGGEFPEHAPHHHPRFGVEAVQRLVEEEEPRPAEERGGHRRLAAHPVRALDQERVGLVGQAERR